MKYKEYIVSDMVLIAVVAMNYYMNYYRHGQSADMSFFVIILTVVLLTISMFLEIRRKDEKEDKVSKILTTTAFCMMVLSQILEIVL